MSFNWKAIRSYEEPEVALYRLLGEMLRRKATLDDLDQTRAFLLNSALPSDGWASLGEALHRTTSGSPVGFDIWLSWLSSLEDVDVDEERLGGKWIEFGEDFSEASANEFDPNRDVLPGMSEAELTPTIHDEDVFEPPSDSMRQRALVRTGQIHTGVLGSSPTQLMRLVPQGMYTLRIFGQTYTQVDEYTLVTLIKRGLFLAAEVQFAGRWMFSWEHPAFSGITDKMRAETSRILSRDDDDEPITAPHS